MKRDHVLLLAYEVGRVGGIQRYTYDLAWALMQSGYRVTVLAQDPNSESAPFYSLSTPYRCWSRFWIWWMKALSYFAVLRHDTALIVAAHAGLSHIAYQVARKFNMPYVVCTYGIEVWGEWGKNLSIGLKNADRVVTISQFTASKLRERGVEDKRLFLLPYAIDTDHYSFERRTSGKEQVILTVARLASSERYKGHDFVIQCLPALTRSFPTLEYRIVGAGDDQSRLQRLAESVGVRERVKFCGCLLGKELVAEYHAADVFVMLSDTGQRKDGTWMGEGFGRVYLEAASCGCPVIAANGGGAREAVRDGESGYLIDARDQQAFLRAVTLLLGDEKRCRAMGIAGRKFVEANFAASVLVRKVNALLTELQKSDAN